MRNKSPKSPECARFLQVKADVKLTWGLFSAEIGVPMRTLQHYCWNTGVLSSVALRGAHARFGVSIDWILSGSGSMYVSARALAKPDDRQAGIVDDKQAAYLADDGDDVGGGELGQPLFGWREHMDLNNAQDCFYLWAAAIEQALLESGGVPGHDYTRLDLFKLAQPFVLERHRVTNLDVLIYEQGQKPKD